MSQRFHIRYCCTNQAGHTALIIEDECSTAYLFSGGALQSRTAGPHAAERLLHLLDAPECWQPVPAVPPVDLDGLRRLTAPIPGHAADRPH